MTSSNQFEVIDGGRSNLHGEALSISMPTFGVWPEEEDSVDAETQRYLDKSIEVVRAENDVRFERVISKIDNLATSVENLPKPLGFWSLAGMGATGILAIVTIFGVMADRFDGGIAARGAYDAVYERQQEIDVSQEERLSIILNVLEELQERVALPQVDDE